MLLLLVVLLSLYSFPNARSCGGVVSGGGSSYDFMADPTMNMDMSSYNDFVSDSLGNQQTAVAVQSPPNRPEEAKDADVKPLLINNLSISHNDSNHMSLNLSKAGGSINDTGNTTLAKKIVRLGASGKQDNKTLTWTQLTLNNNLF